MKTRLIQRAASGTGRDDARGPHRRCKVSQDPGSGQVESAYVYLERQRPFLAAKGNNARYEWAEGSPFLLVTAPALSMGTDRQPWWARSIMKLYYAITVDPKEKATETGNPVE